MSCMATEDHVRIVRRVRFRHVMFHLIWAALLAVSLVLPYHLKLEGDLLREAIGTFKMEYTSIKAKQRMIEILRTKPLTIGQAMDIADAVTQQDKVPVGVLFAIMQQESEFTPEAVSNKGAKGLMQVMPVIWKSYALPHFKNVTDPVQNVHVGTQYLADLFKQFGDWKAVFRAYYAGPDNYNNKNYDWYANAVLKKVGEFRQEMGN